MPGVPDPLYVRAREVLLDAIEALGPHLSSIVLVGAQAIYLHTGEGDLAVAPFTTDADVVLDPEGLGDRPLLGEALMGAGFAPCDQPGQWIKNEVRVDLMVPDAVAGAGRRGVRLGPHGKSAARRARGLEGALVDRESREVAALGGDRRQARVLVAGPAALLVSKLHKLAERVGEPGRLRDKDALDIYRLLRGVPTADLAKRLHRLLADPRSAVVAAEAIEHLRRLFGSSQAQGSGMAARAVEALESEQTTRASCALLAEELLSALR